MEQQLNLFSEMYAEKRITKPVRLIELFAGIGAQHRSLSLLTDKLESYKICEWAYNSILCYNAIHIKDFKDYSVGKSKDEMIKRIIGISINYNEPLSLEQLKKKNEQWIKSAYNNIIATHNLINIMNVRGKDLEITNKDKYEYVLTYSFPCQDISLAGLRKGMATSQKESGTRSGLLWEVERILCELDKEHRPDILLMENVPEVIGAGNLEYFNKWELKLEELGYQNYIKILNGKNYGIPQNRRRCFMISILGDYSYNFNPEMTLKYKLKDLLEKNVDEKYYLSDKMLNYMLSINKTGRFNRKTIFERQINKCKKGIAPTITTHNGNRPCDPFIESEYSSGGGLPIIEKTKKGFKIAQEGDGVNISSRAKYQRGNVQKDKSQTLKTSIEVGVVVKK